MSQIIALIKCSNPGSVEEKCLLPDKENNSYYRTQLCFILDWYFLSLWTSTKQLHLSSLSLSILTNSWGRVCSQTLLVLRSSALPEHPLWRPSVCQLTLNRWEGGGQQPLRFGDVFLGTWRAAGPERQPVPWHSGHFLFLPSMWDERALWKDDPIQCHPAAAQQMIVANNASPANIFLLTPLMRC